MTTACIAIIIVVMISAYMCMRKEYKQLGYSILPIAFVPAGHILGTVIIVRLMKAGGLLRETAAAMSIVTAVDVAACVIGCFLISAASKGIFRRKSTRRTFVSSMSIFMAILTLALLINYYRGF